MRLPRLIAGCALLLVAGCGSDTPSRPNDREPPGTVTDLLARARDDSSIILTWTAPGDDGRTGRAYRYEIRTSTESSSTDDWWESSAIAVEAPPAPAPAGAPEEFHLEGLTPEETYWFRLQTFDEAGNGSALSNAVFVTVEPPRPPAVDDLTATRVTSSWIDLSWTSPTGAASAPVEYQLRRSLEPIDLANWEAADSIGGLPVPGPPGAAESFRLGGLEASRTYYLALRTRAESRVLSLIEDQLVLDTPSIRLLRGANTVWFPSLRTAIDDAEDGDVIELSAGVFTGGENRDIVVDGKSITLRGPTGNDAECRIDLERSGRALAFLGEPGGGQNGSVVQWVTFENGFAGLGDIYGGAVVCSGGGPAFITCRFVNNHADGGGGAVALDSGSEARFESCQFEGNDASSNGGALWSGTDSSPRIKRSTFTGNVAVRRGGAVAIRGGSPVFEDRCVFRDNEAGTHGGAISFEDSGGEVRDTVFLTNEAGTGADAGGGAVECYNTSSPVFERCQFQENVTSKWGGAVYAWDRSSPEFTESIFLSNSAEQGGAAVSYSRSVPELDRCTIVENAAQFGGGLRAIGADSGFVLARSILAFNSSGGSIDCQDGVGVDVQCSLIYGNVPRDWSAPCIESQAGEPGNLDADPLFCFPEILDYRLAEESPAANTATCGTLGAREVGCSR